MVQFIEDDYFRKGCSLGKVIKVSSCSGEIFKFIEYSVIAFLDITRDEWAYRLSLSSKNESIMKEKSSIASPKPHPNPRLLKIANSIDLNNVVALFSMINPPQAVKTLVESTYDMLEGSKGSTFRELKTKMKSELPKRLAKYDPDQLSGEMSEHLEQLLEQTKKEQLKASPVCPKLFDYLLEVVRIAKLSKKDSEPLN